MRRTKSKSDSSPLLPQGSQPCIWMTAGLIAYGFRIASLDYPIPFAM